MKKYFLITILILYAFLPIYSQNVWTGQVFGANFAYVQPPEQTCDIVQNGLLYLPPGLSTISNYWVQYAFDTIFCIKGDSATFEICFRRGQIDAYDTRISYIGINDTAQVTLMGSTWAQTFTSIEAGSTYLSNIPQLVRYLKPLGWDTLTMQLQNGVISAYFNDSNIYQMNYAGSIDTIRKLLLVFKGSGAVDWVKLYNSSNDSLIYFEDFTSCTSFAPPCGLIQSFIPTPSISSSDTLFCEKQCINFFDLSTNNPTSWQWYFPGGMPDTSTQQNPTNICYNNYGSFDVTLIACNSAGCDTLTIPNFINEYQNPVDSIYQSNDTLYSLTAYSYQWYNVGSGLISGATNQFYVPQNQGSYYCVIGDSIGCIATSNIITVTASWQLAISSWQFSIQPNPSSENLQIQFQNNFNDDVEVEISNVLGDKVFNQKFSLTQNSKNISVDVSTFNDGIYFITIQSKLVFAHEKFVVKK